MYKNLYFSKFAHFLKRESVYACFNSLKMKPVYLDDTIYKQLNYVLNSENSFVEDEVIQMDNGKILAAIDALVANRVINEKKGRDKEVISYFRKKIIAPNIKIAYFIIAESCNMSCRYCFENAPSVNHTKHKSFIMNKEVALKSVDFFERMLRLYPSENEEKNIIFYGGEPLLNYDILVFLLHEIQSRKESRTIWKNTNLSLVTNGTLFEEEMVDVFNNFNLSISFSIDGPKIINDKNRFFSNGKSSFEKTMSAINICKKKRMDFSLSVTLSNEAVQEFDSVISFIKEIGPNSIGFNILMSDGNLALNKNYSEKAADFIINAFKELKSAGIYEDRIMRKIKSFTKSEVYPFDCGATGSNQIVIAPNGQIGICHGYIKEKKFFPSDVFDLEFQPKNDPVFIDWMKRSPLNMRICQKCAALGICGGGCPMNAEKNFGSIWKLDKRFCTHAKKTLEWLIWELYDKSNNGSLSTRNDS